MSDTPANFLRSWRWMALFALILVLPLGLSLLAPEETQRDLAHEGSSVEILSEGAHLLGFALLTAMAFLRAPRTVYPALVLLVLGLREMDFHDRFTTMNVTKIKFFVSDEVGLGEKSLGLLVYVLLALLVYKLWVHYSASFKDALRRWDPGAVFVLAAFILGVVTKVFLDGLPRKLAAIGIELKDPSHLMGVVEETLELSLALLLLVAAVRHAYALLRNKPGDGGAYSPCARE